MDVYENRVELVGTALTDPSVFTFESGNRVACFYLDLGNNMKIRVDLRGEALDYAERTIQRGDKIYLCGQIYSFEIITKTIKQIGNSIAVQNGDDISLVSQLHDTFGRDEKMQFQAK